MRILGGGAVPGGDVESGHAPRYGAGPEETDVRDDVLHVPRLRTAHQILSTRTFELLCTVPLLLQVVLRTE